MPVDRSEWSHCRRAREHLSGPGSPQAKLTRPGFELVSVERNRTAAHDGQPHPDHIPCRIRVSIEHGHLASGRDRTRTSKQTLITTV